MPHAIVESLRRRQDRLDGILRERRFDHPALAYAGDMVRMVGSKAFLACKAAEVKSDDSTMSATFTISSVRRDRHQDVVLPKGCLPTVETFGKNPGVYYNHKTWAYPVGNACTPDGKLALDVLDDRILSTCYFHGKTEESEQIYALVSAKVLRGASIGFRPILGERVKPPEPAPDAPRSEVNFENYWYSFVFKLWELLEWSVVTIPANADAVSMALSKSWAGRPLAEPIRRELEPYLPARRSWDTGTREAERAMNLDELRAQITKGQHVQTYLVPKAKFSLCDEAAAYLEGLRLGLDTSDVEETPDSWAFLQFDAAECEGAVVNESLDDGTRAVLSARKAVETPGKVAPETPAPAPTPAAKVLPGVAFLKALKAVISEHLPQQDNRAVKAACAGCESILAAAAKAEYPECDFGFAAGAGGESGAAAGPEKTPEKAETPAAPEIDFGPLLAALEQANARGKALEATLYSLTGR